MYTPFAETLPENFNVTRGFVTSLGYDTMEENDIEGWTIEWFNRKSQFGLCNYTRKTIFLSTYLFGKLEDKRDMVDTVLHEIAHIIAGHKEGHGTTWQAICLEIGARPERCGTNQITRDKMDTKLQ